MPFWNQVIQSSGLTQVYHDGSLSGLGTLASPLSVVGGTTAGYQVPTSGSVNGSNTTFVWAVAPQVIIVDQGRSMDKVSEDGTVNWVGTTSTVLTIAPVFDIFACA